MLSDLESSTLRDHGDKILEFNQNTVPFDFDGKRLLWMDYKSREDRDIKTYTFDTKAVDTVLTFNRTDGLVSHMKFVGNKIFYIA
jgi:hypothetical protein